MSKFHGVLSLVCGLVLSSHVFGQCCEPVVYEEPLTVVSDLWHTDAVVVEHVAWPQHETVISYGPVSETPMMATEVVLWEEPIYADTTFLVSEPATWDCCGCVCAVVAESTIMEDQILTDSMILPDSVATESIVTQAPVETSDSSYTVAKPALDTLDTPIPSEDPAVDQGEGSDEDNVDSDKEGNRTDEDKDAGTQFSDENDEN